MSIVNKRRNSLWLVEELQDNEDVNEHNNNGNDSKRTRRNSMTPSDPGDSISEANALNSNTTTGSEHSGSAVLKPPRPAKIDQRRRSQRLMDLAQKNAQNNTDNTPASLDQAVSDTASTTDATATITISANNHTVNDNNAATGTSYQLKPRCELSIGILNYFDDILPKPNDPESLGLSAICVLCKKRKSYLKGNISNLKTHLKRVNDVIKLIKHIQSFFLFVSKHIFFIFHNSLCIFRFIPKNIKLYSMIRPRKITKIQHNVRKLSTLKRQ